MGTGIVDCTVDDGVGVGVVEARSGESVVDVVAPRRAGAIVATDI
jgi:hypothetical protein